MLLVLVLVLLVLLLEVSLALLFKIILLPLHQALGPGGNTSYGLLSCG